MWREKENIFCQEVDVEKKLEDVTTEARCIVQHPGFDETREGWLRLHLFCYKTSPHSASQVFVFFGLHPVVSVNAAKNGTVLDNLSVNIIYIYDIYIYINAAKNGTVLDNLSVNIIYIYDVHAQVIQIFFTILNRRNREHKLYDWFYQKGQLSAL